MKAITLWQPYATWIGMKWKTIETRDHDRFKGLVGKRSAIHAGRFVDREALKSEVFLERMRHRGQLDMVKLQNFLTWMMMCRGKIVCTAKVIKGLWGPDVTFIQEWREWDRQAMCDCKGKFLLFLEDIQPLPKPIPFKGGRGIFNVSVETFPQLIDPVNPVNPVGGL